MRPSRYYLEEVIINASGLPIPKGLVMGGSREWQLSDLPNDRKGRYRTSAPREFDIALTTYLCEHDESRSDV